MEQEFMLLEKLKNPKKTVKTLYMLATGRAVVVDHHTLTELQEHAARLKSLQELQNMRPPVFIFGPPRSGSTFLVVSMNTHEKIFVTSELRVMSFVNDLFRRFLTSKRHINWNLKSRFKDNFLTHFRKEMGDVVKSFYLQQMPSPDAVWGDKHPHYADPANDPGALDTILELFPKARFIHIYRNPRAQIYSVVSQGWQDFRYAVNAYKRIVTVGQALGNKVGTDRYMEVRYENLCDHGEDVADQICQFLEIPPSQNWYQFIRQQEAERTPYSLPVTDVSEIGKNKHVVFSPEEEAYFQKILGKLVIELGYE